MRPTRTTRWPLGAGFGFPVPTALLLFVFWPFPAVFVALYLRHFDRQVLADGEFDAFVARLDALRDPPGEAAGDGGGDGA